MKNNSIKKKNGFTLIELLVVMIILSALVFIAASSFQSSQLKSRDTRRKSDLKQISNALETFYADKGYYPASNSSYQIVGCGTSSNLVACTAGAEFSLTTAAGSKAVYMVQLPDDPKDGDYLYVSNGDSYQLFARLENHKDPSTKNPSDEDPDTDEGKDIYGSLFCGYKLGCNFGVSSTNVPLDPVISGSSGSRS